MRTTINVSASTLEESAQLRKTKGVTVCGLVSKLLAYALARNRANFVEPDLTWNTRVMRARLNLPDKETARAQYDSVSL